MTDFIIKKGIAFERLDRLDIVNLEFDDKRCIEPLLFDSSRRWKTTLKVGDSVKINETVCFDRRSPEFAIGSPFSGFVGEIVYGERRTLLAIHFTVSESQNVEVLNGDFTELMKKSGLFSLIKERPFGFPVSFQKKPKAIFINAVDSAPESANSTFIVKQKIDFVKTAIATLEAESDVFISCFDEDKSFWQEFSQNVFSFNNLHPAGCSSVQIAKIRPNLVGQNVWTVDAVNLPLIGELLQTKSIPQSRLIKPAFGYSEFPLAVNLQKLKCDGKRLIGGNLLNGHKVHSSIAFGCAELNELKEKEEHLLFGWIYPGVSALSKFFNPLFKLLAKPLKRLEDCRSHGGLRTLVFPGIYDKVMPLNIKVDFLLKSIMANDIDEAVSLGLLEIVPEDLALAEYLCPSKLPLQKMVADALLQAKGEGVDEVC